MASTAHTGSIATSTNPLQIGGDSIYGQYFAGLIDEVRVYNTALTAAQIQTDEGTPIGATDGSRNLTANAITAGEIDLAWGASTGSHGVTGYQVERCQGAGCSNFTQIATPSGTSYKDTSVSANNSYSYRVRAVDSVGNLGAYSNVATATTGLSRRAGHGGAHLHADGAVHRSRSWQRDATWSVDGVAGGNATVGTITSGGLYTPPSTVGTHTVTATSGAQTPTQPST